MRGRFSSVIALGVIAAGLSSCGGNNAPTSPPTAATLSVGFSVKQLQFSWTPATGVASYRLLESPDGMSAFVPVGEDVGGRATSSNLDITVYKENWGAARYALDACNAVGCTRSNEVTITAGMLAAIGYFKASNTGANDNFGSSVALSSDGNTLVVGAVREASSATGINGSQADNSATDSGAVYVFTRAGRVWSQQAYIKASNAEAYDYFGGSLALSSDGNTLAVSATHESSNATGIGGNQTDNSATDSGAAYVFIRTGSAWSQQAYVKASNTEAYDYFGGSLALSSDGSTLAVGAHAESSSATGIGGNQGDNSAANSGAAYVFTRTGGVWAQQAYVKSWNTGANDQFGASLALSSDGNTLAVGANGEASSATGIGGNQADNSTQWAGAAYVFTRAGGVWSQQAYIKASNTQAYDQFGVSAALSSDGNTLAVGAVRGPMSATPPGAVYVFTRVGGAWAEQAAVNASNTGAADEFGGALALSSDGNTLAVGAFFESSSATGIGGNQADNSAKWAGAVYVFTRASGVWAQRAYVKAPNTGANDWFGYSVALSSDGNMLAVGAESEASSATGINGNQADNSAIHSGAVYLY